VAVDADGPGCGLLNHCGHSIWDENAASVVEKPRTCFCIRAVPFVFEGHGESPFARPLDTPNVEKIRWSFAASSLQGPSRCGAHGRLLERKLFQSRPAVGLRPIRQFLNIVPPATRLGRARCG
jgi:hypothetical protein